MTNNNQQGGQYVGGFSFGGQNQGQQGQQGGQAQPVPPAPQAVPQAYPAPAPAPVPAPMPAAPAAQGPGAAFPPATGGAAQPPAGDPNYRFAERMKTFTTTIVLPAHSLQFDGAYFLNLLAGSISLTKDEKKKIIDSMPKLRQAQVDELIRIFEEERAKFIELSPKHGTQLKKLEDEHIADWRDIELMYKQAVQSEEDTAKADEIRKQLGL